MFLVFRSLWAIVGLNWSEVEMITIIIIKINHSNTNRYQFSYMHVVTDSWKINDLHTSEILQANMMHPYPQFSYLCGDGPSLWQYYDTYYRRFPSQSYYAASSRKDFLSERRTELSYTARNPPHSASHRSHKTSVNSRARWTAESICISRSDTNACGSEETLSQLRESRPAALATPRRSSFYRSAT